MQLNDLQKLIIYRIDLKMQSFRFESQNIYIIEKTVQFVGKMIAKYFPLDLDQRKR